MPNETSNVIKSISNILDRPVFFDSVEIRQVISDIYECQKTIYNIDNIILTISPKGYLYILEKKSGNIIRISDLFYNLNPKKRKNLEINGFVVTTDKIYLTTKNGKITKVNIKNGNIDLVYRVSRNKISKPYVNNSKIYIIKNNGIVKIN